MDLREIFDAEPMLWDLQGDIIEHKASSDLADPYLIYDWYHEFKPRMRYLVGMSARNADLSHNQIYDVVYRHLCDLLTDPQKQPLVK